MGGGLGRTGRVALDGGRGRRVFTGVLAVSLDGLGRVAVLLQDVDQDRGGSDVVRAAGVVTRGGRRGPGQGQGGALAAVIDHGDASVGIVVDHPVVVVPGRRLKNEANAAPEQRALILWPRG